MSPENQGVFQLLKEVTFRKILAFYNSRQGDRFPTHNKGIFLDGKMAYLV